VSQSSILGNITLHEIKFLLPSSYLKTTGMQPRKKSAAIYAFKDPRVLNSRLFLRWGSPREFCDALHSGEFVSSRLATSEKENFLYIQQLLCAL
jgi:hypothetical protein